jgi:hypothetical protein
VIYKSTDTPVVFASCNNVFGDCYLHISNRWVSEGGIHTFTAKPGLALISSNFPGTGCSHGRRISFLSDGTFPKQSVRVIIIFGTFTRYRRRNDSVFFYSCTRFRMTEFYHVIRLTLWIHLSFEKSSDVPYQFCLIYDRSKRNGRITTPDQQGY